MARTVYTATRSFDAIDGKKILTVDAGTGTVTWEVEHGQGNWIAVKTYTADAAEVIDFGNGASHRFTVTGDATFAI